MVFAIHQCESATVAHVSLPSWTPPTSLFTPVLWVVPEHWLCMLCFMHWTCTGHLLYIWYYTCFNAILSNHPTLTFSCCFCYCCITSVVSDSVWPHRRQPTRLPRPWNFPGKNTGVGCHFLLQCMKVKSESEVTQSCLTLSDLVDCYIVQKSVLHIFVSFAALNIGSWVK